MRVAILLFVYDRTADQHLLSRLALASCQAQDTPADVFILNNGSTWPATREWLRDLPRVFHYEHNESLVQAINTHGAELFAMGYDAFIGVPNDVILPTNCWRKLLEFDAEIVSPFMGDVVPVPARESAQRLHGDIHTSVTMVRRGGWDKLVARDGYYIDPVYFMYASDCDLKMRLPLAGVTTAQLDLSCWHYGGASHRLAPGAVAVHQQADRDRAYFARKWGFPIGCEEYTRRIALLG